MTEPISGCEGPLQQGCPADPSTSYTDCAVDAGTHPMCVYSDRYCACGFTGGAEPGWSCTIIPPGCPTLPPDEGDPCDSTASCLYYPCSRSASCEEGHWHWELLAC